MAEIEFTVTLTAEDFRTFAGERNIVVTDEQIAELFEEAQSDERIEADVQMAVADAIFTRIVKWL